MQTTTNYAMNKIDLTDSPPDITVLNCNFDTIDSEMKKHSDDIGNKASLSTTEKGSLVGAVNEVNAQLAQNTIYSTYKLNKDSNGKFIEVQIKRSDGTLYKKSVLSGGTSPNYSTRTETEYQANGTSIKATRVYALTYDTDGKITSEVLQ